MTRLMRLLGLVAFCAVLVGALATWVYAGTGRFNFNYSNYEDQNRNWDKLDGMLFATKTIRLTPGCTTAASVGGLCGAASVLTFPVPFADTSYTAVCTCTGASTNVPVIQAIVKAASTLTVQTAALTAAAANCGTIDCVAIHD